MSDSAHWRRILPREHKRPGPAALVIRWRVEVALVIGAVVLCHHAGHGVVEFVVGAGALLMVATPTGRAAAAGLWQLLAVPHRLRAAFVEAGVFSRQGRLPWIFWARPRVDAVVVAVGLRSGITLDDVREAAPVILGACGASQVEIVPSAGRSDRARVVVVRPRRGLW